MIFNNLNLLTNSTINFTKQPFPNSLIYKNEEKMKLKSEQMTNIKSDLLNEHSLEKSSELKDFIFKKISNIKENFTLNNDVNSNISTFLYEDLLANIKNLEKFYFNDTDLTNIMSYKNNLLNSFCPIDVDFYASNYNHFSNNFEFLDIFIPLSIFFYYLTNLCIYNYNSEPELSINIKIKTKLPKIFSLFSDPISRQISYYPMISKTSNFLRTSVECYINNLFIIPENFNFTQIFKDEITLDDDKMFILVKIKKPESNLLFTDKLGNIPKFSSFNKNIFMQHILDSRPLINFHQLTTKLKNKNLSTNFLQMSKTEETNFNNELVNVNRAQIDIPSTYKNIKLINNKKAPNCNNIVFCQRKYNPLFYNLTCDTLDRLNYGSFNIRKLYKDFFIFVKNYFTPYKLENINNFPESCNYLDWNHFLSYSSSFHQIVIKPYLTYKDPINFPEIWSSLKPHIKNLLKTFQNNNKKENTDLISKHKSDYCLTCDSLCIVTDLENTSFFKPYILLFEDFSFSSCKYNNTYNYLSPFFNPCIYCLSEEIYNINGIMENFNPRKIVYASHKQLFKGGPCLLCNKCDMKLRRVYKNPSYDATLEDRIIDAIPPMLFFIRDLSPFAKVISHNTRNLIKLLNNAFKLTKSDHEMKEQYLNSNLIARLNNDNSDVIPKNFLTPRMNSKKTSNNTTFFQFLSSKKKKYFYDYSPFKFNLKTNLINPLDSDCQNKTSDKLNLKKNNRILTNLFQNSNNLKNDALTKPNLFLPSIKCSSTINSYDFTAKYGNFNYDSSKTSIFVNNYFIKFS